MLIFSAVAVQAAEPPQVVKWTGQTELSLALPDITVISNQEINSIAGDFGSGVFSAGDTTVAIDVNNARRFLFAFKDSSISGADSVKAFVRFKSGGVTFYAPLAVHDLGQVTSTTNTLIMSPGDGLAGAYVFSLSAFAGADQLFTGTIYIQRTNTRTGEAVYGANTRYWYSYE